MGGLFNLLFTFIFGAVIATGIVTTTPAYLEPFLRIFTTQDEGKAVSFIVECEPLDQLRLQCKTKEITQ